MNTHIAEIRLMASKEALKAPVAQQPGSPSGLSQAEIRRLVMDTIG